MSDTVFIVPLHPLTERWEGRQQRFREMLASLINQECRDWRAYLMGVRGPWYDAVNALGDKRLRITHFQRPAKVTPTRGSEPTASGDKPDKILAAVALAMAYGGGDLIALLDDDDLISSKILAHVKGRLGDSRVLGWTGRRQLFHEVDTGRWIEMARPWTPNTCLMRFEAGISCLHGHHADFRAALGPKRWEETELNVYARTIHPEAVNVRKWQVEGSKYEYRVLDGPPEGF